MQLYRANVLKSTPRCRTAPTRPALRARYDRRRRAVVDAAAHVFAERGYHATTIAALLEQTGLSAGALYHYVTGRDELLVLICDELLDPLLERAQEILAADAAPEAQLRELLRAWLAHIERHLDHMRVFQQERHVIERDPRWQEIRAKRLAFERLLDGLLARSRGVRRAGDPQPPARAVRAARHGQLHANVVSPERAAARRGDRRRLLRTAGQRLPPPDRSPNR